MQIFIELHQQLSGPAEPGFWIAASLLLAALATNFWWLVEEGRLGRAGVRSALLRPGMPALVWAVSAVALLLPPALAWRAGAISPYFLGLGNPASYPALGAGSLLALACMGGILVGWAVYLRSLGPARYPLAGSARWLAPLQALVWQWHWSLYRAAASGWLAAASQGAVSFASQPLYWGAWLGLGLAGLESVLNPYLGAHLLTAGRFEQTSRTVALAIVTTALFALTRSFWLCAATHVAVELIVAAWLPGPAVIEDAARAGHSQPALAIEPDDWEGPATGLPARPAGDRPQVLQPAWSADPGTPIGPGWIDDLSE